MDAMKLHIAVLPAFVSGNMYVGGRGCPAVRVGVMSCKSDLDSAEYPAPKAALMSWVADES